MNFKDFIKTVDDDSNKKGDQFEKFCKWFLENDPVWKSQIKKVWLWNDWPERWGADLGIDLVFEHINGEIWAVQSKCYGEDNPVTKKDMNSFLSESNRPQIQQRLLMASTDVIGANARSVCKNQEKKVTFQLLSDFIDSKLDYPEHINKLSKAKLLPKPKPREHQAESIKNVIKGFKKADRGQLIMACGTGKTFTTLWIKEKLEAETTLILLPSLSLLSQTLKEWSYAANQPFKSLAVCSDDSVTKGAEEDSAQNSTQDLSFPVSSDPKVIAKFLKQEGYKVIFSTYQSSPMIAEAMKSKTVPILDLVICDEAHRCAGKVGSTFTTVLDDKKIRTKQKLFTTATPRTYSSNVKKAAKDQEIIITGMDDEKVFGSVFHKLSFGEAIEKELLTDYQVVIVGVDEPMVKEWIDERKILELNKDVDIDAGSLAAQVGILKAIKDYDLKRLISFHSRVSRAKKFSQDILSILPIVSKKDLPKGTLKTDYVSGQMATNQRRQKLEQLKHLNDCDRQILSNARCLSEGVDVPALEGIAIIDPRKSQVDVVQTVGRAIRLSEGKNVGTIVIPVFIQSNDDPELAIENSNFKPVYDVLNALKAHDEKLAFELDEMRTEMGRMKASTGPSREIPKVQIVLPKHFTLDFAKSIQTVLVERSTESWGFWFAHLERYIEENNHMVMPRNYQLSTWVGHQRRNRKNQTLSKERIKKLNTIGFVWDAFEDAWNQGFELTKEYIDIHGSLKMSEGYKTENGFNLSGWVSHQRRDRVNKILSKERIRKLNSISFVWNQIDHQWEIGYEEFKSHVKNNNSLILPKGFKTPSGYRLQAWVNLQRMRKNQNKLEEDKIIKLDKLKFVWDPAEELWNRGYEELKWYKEKYKTLTLPKGYKTPSGYSLQSWVGGLRNQKKANQLTDKKIALLNKLGLVWDPLEEIWNNAYKALQNFSKTHNSLNVPRNYISPDNIKLGFWAQSQRTNKRRNKLSIDKISKLDALKFIWEPSKINKSKKY